ncbi:hypothetical protein [Okeania sp. KiyG1]|uniref:hypothetical protein n=1 Tax=Okeania sp. KiyG1 TaxID=2720165 RepID=UPI001923D38D|nr:hypothetical protein [Okeania sp. KiyG1]GGA50970.1 hypothetical protein CYANOKiyG1_70610 [Okeania sp. KiyG1]
MTTNTGETVSVPKFYRKSQFNLARKRKHSAISSQHFLRNAAQTAFKGTGLTKVSS